MTYNHHSKSAAQRLVFSDDSPNSFPCAVLLNVNRVGSTGKRTLLGVQLGRSEATIQIFKNVRVLACRKSAFRAIYM